MINAVRSLTRRVVDRVQAHRRGSGALLRGTAMMAVAEMGNRVTRIFTAIVLARVLTTVEFGMIGLILTTYEFVRMFIHNGVGARIIQAREDELDEVCGAANRLNWVVGAIMCVIQISVALPVQWFFGANVAPMLMVLGIVHLLYPIGLTHACLALRDNRLGYSAGMLFFQISSDNILTAVLVLLGWGLWAVVIPKVIVAGAWIIISRLTIRDYKRVPVSSAKMWEVIAYSRCVFGSEALNTFRAYSDKLIVSASLGLEAFGIYNFASNTGAGIATGLATALGQAVLPYLSRDRDTSDLRARFMASTMAMSFVIMPLVAAQVILAPWYVPIVFGEKWIPAIPTLMLMSLGVLSRPLIVATSQLLRATGEVDLEWRISWINAILFVVAIIGGLPFGVEGVAACLSAISILPAIFFARMALQGVARDRRVASGNLAGANA